MDVSVGDKVQIVNGGIDVTNGGRAKAGKMYGEGGPLWATVTAIVEGWATGSRWGLPATVTKVRCANEGVVVWQVRPEDIYKQVVKVEEPTPEPEPDPPPEPEPTPEAKAALAAPIDKEREVSVINIGASNAPFANLKNSADWFKGSKSVSRSTSETSDPANQKTQVISKSMFSGLADRQTPSYSRITVTPSRSDKERRLPTSMSQLGTIYKADYKTSWQDAGRRAELKNQDKTLIQNEYGFPRRVGPAGTMLADKYDYQIIPGDTSYNGPTRNLDTRLMELRAALGIPVHGNNDIARSVKYYMYNRFKTPDRNLAHNRTITHIFFTRPDLNLLQSASRANVQTMNHTDTALLWRRNPELFKLLTDYKRCGDTNNFNMLLSNQIASFNLTDETLSTIRAGRSWNDHEMMYGEQYTGRTAGEFTCTFNETSEYSVINLLKLWMTYIDNVSRGAWSPNYNKAYCHVFDRALDYAASLYVFKCGPDGEDILYWTKYYGIFPISTGAGSLSWELSSQVGDSPKPSITFAYSYKKDLSPISLLEFNHVANVSGNVSWVPSYDTNLAHSARPYVGAPYIELDLGVPRMQINDVNRASKRTQIRLKFRKDTNYRRTDKILFKANMV